MKEKINQIFSIASKIKPHTYISIVMLLFLIINNISVYIGGSPIIQFSEDTITDAVNIILNIVFICYTFWKNQSFTSAALAADDVLTILKDGKVTREELEDFIEKYKSPDVPTEDTDAVEVTETTDKIETVETETTEATDDEAKG